MWQFAKNRLTKYGFQKPEATMLFDTLKMSCDKLAEKDGEFKFLLQSFIKEHSSVNGLVDMKTVTSLYDMILDHARAYVVVKPEASKAVAAKTQKTSGCFNCGGMDHWAADCPKNQGQGKGQSSSSGANNTQQSTTQKPAKGKTATATQKGQSKGTTTTKQTATTTKGKGKGSKLGKKGAKGTSKGAKK